MHTFCIFIKYELVTIKQLRTYCNTETLLYICIMEIDSRINKVERGFFRIDLYSEDLNYFNENVRDVGDEKILVFPDKPVRYNNLGVYYSNKIREVDSNYSETLFSNLIYINEGITDEGIDKMITFIISNFIKFDRVESWNGESTVTKYVAAVSREDILNKITELTEEISWDWEESDVIYDKVAFYSRKSNLTSEEKRAVTLEVRNSRNSILTGAMIHNAVLSTIEHDSKYLHLSRRTVKHRLPLGKVTASRTFNKHITQDTKDVIVTENNVEGRVIRSKAQVDKIKEFERLRGLGMSTEDVLSTLHISNTTFTLFKKITSKDE